jgi:hypothetical protein
MGKFYSYNGQSVNPIIRINGLNVGIAENSRKEEILLFPNPAHDYCELQFPANKIRNLIVYSLDGKTIKRQVESRIDLTELAQGLYVIQIIETNGVTYHCKLVKD